MYLSDNKEDFLNFPKELYANDPFYTIQNEDIADCEKLFVVKDGNKVLARAGILNCPRPLREREEFLSERSELRNSGEGLQVGFFEAENNPEAVNFLFDEIKKYAKAKGYDYLIGAINGSTWKKYRVTLPSENPPFLLDNYNKPYYAELFEI